MGLCCKGVVSNQDEEVSNCRWWNCLPALISATHYLLFALDSRASNEGKSEGVLCYRQIQHWNRKGFFSFLESVRNVLSMKCKLKIMVIFGYPGFLHREIQTLVFDFTWCSVKS